MTLEELTYYQKVQNAARYTQSAITQYIKPGVSVENQKATSACEPIPQLPVYS